MRSRRLVLALAACSLSLGGCVLAPPPAEQVDLGGLHDQLEVDRDDLGLTGSFIGDDGGLVYFETLRGEPTLAEDNWAPAFRIDARFSDEEGRPFSLAVGGHSVIDSSWHAMGEADVTDRDARAADFERARAAADLLFTLDLGADLEPERGMLIDLGRAVTVDDLVDEESAGARDATYVKKVDVLKKTVAVEDLYGDEVDHSALSYKVYEDGGLLTTRLTCNHGVCADSGGLGLHCTATIESTTADYPFQAEPCSTVYGPKDGSHLSNDDSYLQLRAVIAGAIGDDATCGDELLRDRAPDCEDVTLEVEEEEPVSADGACVPVSSLAGWTQVVGDNSVVPPATDNIDFWPSDVAVGNYEGAEIAYQWTAPASVEAKIKFVGAHPTQVNHDIFLLDGSGDCLASAALLRGFNDLTYEVTGGQRYYVVVDGFDGDIGAFTLKFEED